MLIKILTQQLFVVALLFSFGIIDGGLPPLKIFEKEHTLNKLLLSPKK